MASLKFSVQPHGLLCDVMIGLDGKTTAALIAAQQVIPAPVLCRGLIDTGTDVTCVASRILRQLGLNIPAVRTTTQTAVGGTAANLFEASVNVLDVANPSGPKLVSPDMLVMEIPAPLANFEVLIGLDILLTAQLHLDGPAREFTLVF
jgi:hypothetical protein